MDNAALYKDAQEAIRVRDEFLSIASHELKTPLTPLKLQIETVERRVPKLVKDKEGAAWIRERLGVLNRQGERLERLVNEMLDISRIVGGRLCRPDTTAGLGSVSISPTKSSRRWPGRST